MTLRISIVKSPEGVTSTEESKTFTEQGGSIGRGADNTWILSDPDRFLSSLHCEITFEAGQYYLTDLSTNGTFINRSLEPIGKGGRVVLHDGDTFDVGDYRFAIVMSAQSAKSNVSPFAGVDAPFDDASAFGITSTHMPENGNSGQKSNLDDIFGGGPSAAAEVSLSSTPEEMDPLAALDKMSSSGDAPMSSHLEQQADFDPLPPFSLGGGNDEDNRGSQGDNAGLLNEAVRWPESKQENVIPEDWEDDLLGAGNKSQPFQAQINADRANPQSAGPVIPDLTDDAGLDWLDAKPGEAEPKASPRKLANASSPPDQVKPPVKQKPSIQKPPIKVPVTRSAVGKAAAVKSPPTVAGKAPTVKASLSKTAAKTSMGNNNSAADAKVIQGLGLAENNLSEEQIGEIAAIVGELLPEIIEGMMQVLRSRASIKNEFRMNITTIQPVENNPLKFSADTKEALENMFLRKSSAYKKPKEAFREGFNSIAEHQVAIIAGIRAAFKNIMECFDPDKLERQFDKQVKGVTIPGMQKARYWSSYTEYYKNYVDNMEQSFQYLFGDEFVHAYEDQLRKLVAARKRTVNPEN